MAQGKFILSAENRLKEGLDAAQKDLGGFTGAAENLGKRLEAAFTATAIIAGLKKIGEATFDAYKEFGEAERRLNTLKIALDNNDASIRRATGLIGDMAKISLSSKDDIEALVSELAALGKSDAQIESITKASVNLANVTGKDLNSAFTLVNATYDGSAGKLSKLIPEIGNLTKEELAAGGATALINTRFTELSATIAGKDISQNLKNLKDSFGDLKENIGEMTTAFFSPLISGIQAIVDKWNDAYGAQKTYAENTKLMKDIETKSEGERLTAALANAGRDKETFYQTWRRSMLSTPGLSRMVGGEATPIYTPKQSFEAGFFKDVLQKYFSAEAMQASFRISLENFTSENPNWKTPRTTTTGGAPLAGGGGAEGLGLQELFGGYKIGSGVMGQSGIPGRLGVNIPLGNESNIRDDLESYGWTAEMLAAPIIEFRDDLESYGWSADMLLKPVQDFRDDLESYGWDQLFMSILPDLPTDGGGFRAQGQSTISGPVSGGGQSAAAQIASNMGIAEMIGSAFGGSLSTATNGMDSFSSAISGSMGSLMSALGPFANMIAGMNPILALLVPVFDGFMQVVGPALSTVIEPIMGVLVILGQMLGQILLPQLEMLGPIVQKLAEGFVWFYNNALRHVANGFVAVFNILSNSVIGLANAFIDIINWLPDWLVGGNIDRIDFRGLTQGFLQEITLGQVNTTGASNSGTSTASQSASYRTQAITVNIYQNAAVVGTGGITEFARMIRGEIATLAYYGA